MLLCIGSSDGQMLSVVPMVWCYRVSVVPMVWCYRVSVVLMISCIGSSDGLMLSCIGSSDGQMLSVVPMVWCYRVSVVVMVWCYHVSLRWSDGFITIMYWYRIPIWYRCIIMKNNYHGSRKFNLREPWLWLTLNNIPCTIDGRSFICLQKK